MPIRSIRIALLLAAAACASACGKQSESLTPDQLALEMGKAIYTTCAGCHGNDGQGRDYMYAPDLAGQDADYLKRQLAKFREGQRGKLEDPHGFQMVGRAEAIGVDKNVDAVVAYIGSLPALAPKDLKSQSIPAGLEAQINTCASCHGADGGGNSEMGGPALTSLDSAYIAKQLRKFREGLRGYDEADAQGQTMALSAQAISQEEDIDRIASYYGK